MADEYQTKYHVHKMLERKAVRQYEQYSERRALQDGAEIQRRIEEIKADMEFDAILRGNTETASGKAKRTRKRLTPAEWLFAWWVGHAS